MATQPQAQAERVRIESKRPGWDFASFLFPVPGVVLSDNPGLTRVISDPQYRCSRPGHGRADSPDRLLDRSACFSRLDIAGLYGERQRRQNVRLDISFLRAIHRRV